MTKMEELRDRYLREAQADAEIPAKERTCGRCVFFVMGETPRTSDECHLSPPESVSYGMPVWARTGADEIGCSHWETESMRRFREVKGIVLDIAKIL